MTSSFPAMEHHFRTQKTARYYTLGSADSAREVWFVLHGYQQLAGRFINRFRPLDDGTRLVVAPEALSRFYVSQAPGRHGPESKVGATWMTREDRLAEIDDYVSYLDALAESVLKEAHGAQVTVLGFSQGVATAARWVTLGGVRPERVVLWGDHAPPDLDLERAREALEGVDLVLARGSRDRVIEGPMARREEDSLGQAGISFRIVAYEGGHEIDPRTLMDLA